MKSFTAIALERKQTYLLPVFFMGFLIKTIADAANIFLGVKSLRNQLLDASDSIAIEWEKLWIDVNTL